MKSRVRIQGVCNIRGVGVVTTGAVVEGVLRRGMRSEIGGKVMTVKHIESRGSEAQEASQGDDISLLLENGDCELIRTFLKKEVTFSDEGQPPAHGMSQEPVHPKGGLMGRFFRR